MGSRRNQDRNEEAEALAASTQWSHLGDGVWTYAEEQELHNALPAGFYNCKRTYSGPQLHQINLQTDDLLDFTDGAYAEVMERIETFWAREEEYQKYGALHRLGLLFYGPQGCGKTAMIQQVGRRAVKRGHLVLMCTDPHAFVDCVDMVRHLEADRPIVAVMEDLDELLKSWDEAEMLQWLDGNKKINHLIVLATTNYPEELDKRIVRRPKRFDRLIRINHPTEDQRRVYFQQKLGQRTGASEIERWVSISEGLSFAALSELLVSVKCANMKLQDAATQLRELEHMEFPSEDEEEGEQQEESYGSAPPACVADRPVDSPRPAVAQA